MRPASESCRAARRPAEQRPGEGEPGGIALAGQALDGGTTRVAEPQHLRDLVEGFAQRIVDRGAEPPIAPYILDDQKLAVTARHQQQQVGKIHVVGQPGGQRVAFEMVDRDQRQPMDEAEGLGGDEAHHQPADQPGPRRRRYGCEVTEAEAGLAHRRLDQQVQPFDMGAGGDLGHHAAIGSMQVELCGDRSGKDPAVRGHQGRRRLVAARLDAQDDRLGQTDALC